MVLAGEQSVGAIADRCGQALGKRWRWVPGLAKRYLKAYEGRARPRRRELVKFLAADEGFSQARAKYGAEIRVVDRFVGTTEMLPVEAARKWDLPAIRSVGELADWCAISVEELQWFANLKGLADRSTDSFKLKHYSYRAAMKASGGTRLIESPKKKLKELQRQILHWIVDLVPVHAAAHGFVRGRSIKTFAEPHERQELVLRVDLQDFFPSIRRARIQTVFRTMGYPEAVADLLGGICTNAVPLHEWREFDVATSREVKEMYRRFHLPQGAPSSPALANLCAYRMDCRLAGLAKAAGANYSRYADDLAFSGGTEFAPGAARFADHAGAVILEEGFAVNFRKTRAMRRGERQHLAGLVVNDGANVKRDEFDTLRAILHNCAKFGPESQNREGRPAFQAHLAGRISFVEMVRPAKGARLRRLFNEIRW